MGIYGIDVSNYQPQHFPTTVQGHAVDFAFIKASEGTSYVNPVQAAQTAWARSHGLVTGFYHFLHAGNINAQAAYFVAKADSVAGDLLACDWEMGGVSGADKDAFLKEVKRLRPDHRVGLYCDASHWLHVDKTSYVGDFLWLADYNGSATKTGIQHAVQIHQYTSTPVDTNYAAAWANRAEMKAWATGSKAPTVPAKPKPVVDLSNIIAAAKTDPRAKQGHTTHAADVKLVEAALKAEKLLSATYASDGSYGTATVAAYAKWQRKLGYSGKAADGIPGSTSLKKLGDRHGFTVKA